MRSVLTALLSTGLLLAASPATAQSNGPEGISQALDAAGPSVVSVEVSRLGVPQQLPALRELTIPLADVPSGILGTQVLSGVVTDGEKGHILTNYVGDPGVEFSIRLADGQDVEAELLGIDRRTGLALLDVDGVDLTALTPAAEGALHTGDPVVIVSNPFGSFPTGRLDHVSLLGDHTVTPHGLDDYVVFGAPAKGTERGSAIVTLDGQFAGLVVGTEEAERAAGLAVPAATAMAIAEQLAKFGEVPAGRLGVMIQNLTADAADRLGLGTNAGTVVSAIAPGSAAETADLRPGDVIVSIDATPVYDAQSLRTTIGQFRAGDAVSIGFLRDGERQDIEIVLGGVENAVASGSEAPERVKTALVPGAVFEEGTDGIRVVSVAPDSPAARAGLRRGDTIVAIDRRQVADLTSLRSLGGHEPAAALTIRRDEQELFLLLG